MSSWLTFRIPCKTECSLEWRSSVTAIDLYNTVQTSSGMNTLRPGDGFTNLIFSVPLSSRFFTMISITYWISRSYLTGVTAKNAIFDPNWAFLDCNSSLNIPMALKCCAKLNVVWRRCPIGFQGLRSNLMVTRYKKSQILTWIGRFRTVTPVWIHQWI